MRTGSRPLSNVAVAGVTDPDLAPAQGSRSPAPARATTEPDAREKESSMVGAMMKDIFWRSVRTRQPRHIRDRSRQDQRLERTLQPFRFDKKSRVRVQCKELRNLGVKVITNIKVLYDYWKSTGDAFRKSVNTPAATITSYLTVKTDSWSGTMRNVIYMRFVAFESARRVISSSLSPTASRIRSPFF